MEAGKRTFCALAWAVTLMLFWCDPAAPATGSSNVDEISYSYVLDLWNHAGRRWMSGYGGVNWSEQRQGWELDEHWPFQDETAQRAYYLEYGGRAAINAGVWCRDAGLLNEVALFYSAYLGRFETLREMRGRSGPHLDGSLLRGRGADSARTLAWVEATGRGPRIRECELCNSQFFHSPARLIRIIAQMAAAQLLRSEREFVRRTPRSSCTITSYGWPGRLPTTTSSARPICPIV